MSKELPITRVRVAGGEAARLRSVIQQTDEVDGWIPDVRMARLSDAAALARLLEQPGVGSMIYTAPSPVTEENVRNFILKHLREREDGEGVLLLAFDSAGAVAGYFDLELWAEWGACKFGGAVKTERQGRGYGGATALAAVDWCFSQLGVERICETTALNNERSIRLLSRMGFHQVAEVVSIRPDGTTRPSLVWELERSRWATPRLRARGGAHSQAGVEVNLPLVATPNLDRPYKPSSLARESR